MILSIIIPIFNAEKVLRRTLDSVLNQGLDEAEYELILINDGSIDNSLNICNEYAVNHPELIKVISKQNEGLPLTRNVGMSLASGDYIYFMDADDYLMPGGFRYLLDNFFSPDIDILAFFSRTINDFDEEHVPKWGISGKITFEGTGCAFLQHSWLTFVWNIWYKKDFLLSHGLLFQNIRAVEDIMFNLQVLSMDPSLRIVSSKLYCYITYDDDRQLTKKRDSAFLRSCIEGQMALFSYVSSLNKRFIEEYNSYNMEILFQSALRSFMSRYLSSDITVREFSVYIHRLEDLGLLPMMNIRNKNAKVKTENFFIKA